MKLVNDSENSQRDKVNQLYDEENKVRENLSSPKNKIIAINLHKRTYAPKNSVAVVNHLIQRE